MNGHQAVLALVEQYLRAIYEGDVAQLRAVFHPDARVQDTVTGVFRSRSAGEYIQGVASRQSPAAAGEPFTMSPLSIEVLADMAVVTAELRFLGNDYINVLSLLRIDGRWLIVHKAFGPPRS
ncbi:nuclear transport factor 2 family protein [Frateuria edaphi]|uniref:nuclear transport factor 2 family protein n=1 Tax=Frateuria edaphi TaxID=2898793 RepID=UPI001E5514C5|nr:nuclear transport factor 2 family protein [Frateuria edaphi]UGB45459.1 nuclear transport factor 2 family protein [Frateuria edaphi]